MCWYLTSTAPNRTLQHVPKLPLLIIHGDADPITGVHHGDKIFARAREPKCFWRVPGGGHINSMQKAKGLYRRDLVNFLDSLKCQPLSVTAEAQP